VQKLQFNFSVRNFSVRIFPHTYISVRSRTRLGVFAPLGLCVCRVAQSPRPAIVVELKYDKTADSAISQIKRKNYPKSLQGFTKRIVLCGINYNKETSKHEVEMEVIEE
jgi:hypothetical protein